MIVRAERAKSNIAKDMEKAKRIAPHEADYQTLRSIENPSQQQLAGIQDYFILLEKFKVSLFAQELGTGQKVSQTIGSTRMSYSKCLGRGCTSQASGLASITSFDRFLELT